MPRIAIIYPKPNKIKNFRFGFSYNWAMLGTLLNNAGYKPLMEDYSYRNFSNDKFINFIKNIDIAIIEFDSFSIKRSENYLHGYQIISLIRKYSKNCKIIVYGHYICINKHDIPNVDITIKTNSLSDIINNINKFLNQKLPVPYSYEDYPIIDRNYIANNLGWTGTRRKSSLIQTSIGCENTCIFCHRNAWQNKFVSHSIPYVKKEFEQLKDLGIINLWITDDNFSFKLKHAKQLLSELHTSSLTKGMNISLSSWTNIDKEFLDLAKSANIKIISFGIENGDKDILQFYQKNIDLEKTRHLINYADKIGLFTIGNFIIGAPGETIKSINETFNYMKSCLLDQVNIKILAYMKGSELYNSLPETLQHSTVIYGCKENGLSDFSLRDLLVIRKDILSRYSNWRKAALLKKFSKFGLPYEPV